MCAIARPVCEPARNCQAQPCLSVRDGSGMTPILVAASAGNLAALRAFLLVGGPARTQYIQTAACTSFRLVVPFAST
jgi:hypothetical protein